MHIIEIDNILRLFKSGVNLFLFQKAKLTLESISHCICILFCHFVANLQIRSKPLHSFVDKLKLNTVKIFCKFRFKLNVEADERKTVT